uniref:Major facilitator superfamily (MFS) profile domain-containing protein n=1 Tax=Chromera velia CCMP2878 TaxID=1169474 RepID=A0A0G4I943_9ALVE|eukprot:Cvel_12114.t1-p1 / transcript=Cvel_12114.t1 / gene=Cvel_12114 / organism=Chromera_velia_CCMP2878 / gene_product=hypothetical protein / transcript_product=hypothetical protein / location=Cvel_scaffold780:42806-46512(-) / protein_length=703 / sequence_SO=supercontig / SO=protein_coding / is_pseudo=false
MEGKGTKTASVWGNMTFVLLYIFFETIPFSFCNATITELYNEQFGSNVYSILVGVDIFVNLLSLLPTAVLGRLSEPSRLGRKSVLMWISLGVSIPNLICYFTSDTRLYLAAQLALSTTGARAFSVSPTILIAWITDWAPGDVRTQLFGLVYAGMSVGSLCGNTAASFFLRYYSHSHALKVAAVLQCMYVIVALAFPGSQGGGKKATSPLGGVGGQQAQGGKKQSSLSLLSTLAVQQVKGIGTAVKVLHAEFRLVLYISLMVNSVYTAVIRSLGMYARRELGLEGSAFSLLFVVMASSGLFAQTLLLPLLVPFLGQTGSLLLGICMSAGTYVGIAAATDGTQLLWILGISGFQMTTLPLLQGIVAACMAARQHNTSQPEALEGLKEKPGPPAASASGSRDSAFFPLPAPGPLERSQSAAPSAAISRLATGFSSVYSDPLQSPLLTALEAESALPSRTFRAICEDRKTFACRGSTAPFFQSLESGEGGEGASLSLSIPQRASSDPAQFQRGGPSASSSSSLQGGGREREREPLLPPLREEEDGGAYGAAGGGGGSRTTSIERGDAERGGTDRTDTGTILGGLAGLNTLVRPVAPLVHSLLLGKWELLPGPIRFASFSFLLMGACMLFAGFLAFLLVLSPPSVSPSPVAKGTEAEKGDGGEVEEGERSPFILKEEGREKGEGKPPGGVKKGKGVRRWRPVTTPSSP